MEWTSIVLLIMAVIAIILLSRLFGRTGGLGGG